MPYTPPKSGGPAPTYTPTMEPVLPLDPPDLLEALKDQNLSPVVRVLIPDRVGTTGCESLSPSPVLWIADPRGTGWE